MVQCVPTCSRFGDAEVTTTPQRAGASRRKLAKAPAMVQAATDIAAAAVPATRRAERLH